MESSLVKIIISISVAYCLGSISCAYIIGRLVSGIDMTEVGNGRIGTAFAIRQLGFGWGIIVGVLDFLKGVAAIALPLALGVSTRVLLLSGLAAVAGHNWSVFLGFKGGRGAATSFGVLADSGPLAGFVVTVALMVDPFSDDAPVVQYLGDQADDPAFRDIPGSRNLSLWVDISLGLDAGSTWLPETSFLMITLAALPAHSESGRESAGQEEGLTTRLGLDRITFTPR